MTDDTGGFKLIETPAGDDTGGFKLAQEDHRSRLSRTRDEITASLAKADREYLLPIFGAPMDLAGWLTGHKDMPGGSKWLGEKTGISGIPEPTTTAGRIGAEVAGQGTAALATGAGLGAAVSGAGRLAGAAGQGLRAAGAEIGDVTQNLFSGIGGGFGGGALEEMTRGSVLEGPAHFLGSLVGGGVGGAMSSPTRVKTVSSEAEKTIEAYERLGLHPTAATAGVGGKAVSWLETNILPQTAGGGGVIDKSLQANKRGWNEAQQTVAQKFGKPAPSTAEAGENLRDEILSGWERRKRAWGHVFEASQNQFKPNEVFHAQHFIDAATRTTPGRAGTASVRAVTDDPLLKEAHELIKSNAGHFPYRDMQQLVSKYGKALSQSYAKDVNDVQVQALRTGLQKDMDEAMKTRGPKVYQNYKDAQWGYAKQMNDYRQAFKDVLEKGSHNKQVPIDGERVYRIFTGAAGTGAQADIAMFRKVWDVLPKAQKGELSATVLSRMGIADQTKGLDSWHIGQFLREYGKLSPEAKHMMFGQTGNQATGQALDDLVRAAESLTVYTKQASSSRSGLGIIQYTQLGGLVSAIATGNPVTMAVSAGLDFGGPWAAAKILTNPTAVRAMADRLRSMEGAAKGVARSLMVLEGVHNGRIVINPNHPQQ